jgi:hypothetical protein
MLYGLAIVNLAHLSAFIFFNFIVFKGLGNTSSYVISTILTSITLIFGSEYFYSDGADDE